MILRNLALLVLAASAARTQIPQQLTLPEAEAMALKNHPSISASRYSALAASEVPKQFEAAYYPTFTASMTGAGAPENSRLGAGALNNPVIYSRLASGVTVNQLIFDFGRTSNLVASAKLRASSSDYRAQAERNRILFEVRRAYLTALRGIAILRVAEATVQARQLVVDQVTELQRARLKSGLDLSFATVSLEEANLLLSSARNERQAAMASLAVAMGTPGAPEYELTEAPFQLDPMSISELLSAAARNRPDLKARSSDIAAINRLVKAERALRFPTLSAIASAGWIPERNSALRGNYSAAGFNVSLPFLNGGLYKARASEAAMLERAATERERELRNEIVREVTLAYLNVSTSAERVELTARLLEQASLALELAQSRYDLGLSSIVELSQAQLAQTSAAIQQTNARYDYQIQKASVDYRIGLQP